MLTRILMPLTMQTRIVSPSSAFLTGPNEHLKHRGDFADRRDGLHASCLVHGPFDLNCEQTIAGLDENRNHIALMQRQSWWIEGRFAGHIDFRLVWMSWVDEGASVIIHQVKAFDVDEGRAIVGRASGSKDTHDRESFAMPLTIGIAMRRLDCVADFLVHRSGNL